MPPITLARLAPLTGVLAIALLIASSVIAEPPAADETTEEVVRWWADNDSKAIVGALIGALAAVLVIWFGGSVRATLRSAEGEPGRVAAIAFGGFLIAGAGAAMFYGFQFVAGDTAGDVPAEVTQTLSALSALFFIPFAVGAIVAFLAAGVCILRHGALPRWLGFAALAIAIAALFPPPVAWVGFIGAAIWILIVSVLLFLREEPASSPSSGEGAS